MLLQRLFFTCLALSLAFTASLSLATDYQQINWVDLMPRDDLEALSQPPDYLDQIEDGSLEDQLSSQMLGALESASDDRYQQALVSTRVVETMDNRKIRIPAFIVPISFNQHHQVTSFFLVPYFGACIHVPPPPPNQIIYVDYPQGFEQKELYDAYWLDGTLSISLTENNTATSAYKMQVDNIELYE